MYPLMFTPQFQERVWGGRSLSRWFADLPPGPIGEAWLLSDHPQGRTVVKNGPLAGETLQSLLQQFGSQLMGTRGAAGKTGQFPLLFKLLDCQDDLSVQVHPSDDYDGLPPGELGKTEMWVVLDAKPGAQVIHGVKPGTTLEHFAEAVAAGRTLDLLRQVTVHPGDVLYVPAGTIHALGKGLLVAEIQQSSDTTYRVYDYDRPGLDGKPRPLHVDHALRVSSFDEGPPITRTSDLGWQELCRSPYFVVSQIMLQGERELATTPESFHALMVLEGNGTIAWANGKEPIGAGSVILIPAMLGAYQLSGSMRILHVQV